MPFEAVADEVIALTIVCYFAYRAIIIECDIRGLSVYVRLGTSCPQFFYIRLLNIASQMVLKSTI